MAHPQTESLRLALKAHLAAALSLDESAFRVDYGKEEGSFACTAALAGLCPIGDLLAACPEEWTAEEKNGFVNFRPGKAVLEKALLKMAEALPKAHPLPKDAVDYGRISRLLAILPRCQETSAYAPLYWAVLADSDCLFPRFEEIFRREYPPVFLAKAIIFQILQKNACILDAVVVE